MLAQGENKCHKLKIQSWRWNLGHGGQNHKELKQFLPAVC